MKRSRVWKGGAVGVALGGTLVALSGCSPRGAAADGGGAGDAAVSQTSTGLCEPDGWCPSLPTDFVTMPTLVGDQLVAPSIDGNRASVRTGSGWQPIECPADAGADVHPRVFAGMTSDTIVACGPRLYRWGAAGFSALPWTGYALWSTPSFALPDAVFFFSSDDAGHTFVSRCAPSACTSVEVPSGIGPVGLVASSADEFTVIGATRASRHTASGWSEVPIESVPYAPQWPPAANATCLADGSWVPCGSSPNTIGPFTIVQRTSRRLLLRGRLQELVTYDGARTEALQSLSLGAFQREQWADLDLGATPIRSPIVWVGPSSVDGVVDRSGDRLFVAMAAAVPSEGTGAPRTVQLRVLTRLGEGPWERIGDDLGECGPLSATALDNVWVRCDDGMRHFDGRAWSTLVLPNTTTSRVCAMNDGSAIVLSMSAGATNVVRVRVGEAPSQQRPANRLVGCTHDDVFAIDASGVIFHRVGDAWAELAPPPVASDQRDLGASDLGITVRDYTRNVFFVWDGALWQERDAARASFDRNRQVAQLSTSEWSVRSFAPSALMVRARR